MRSYLLRGTALRSALVIGVASGVAFPLYAQSKSVDAADTSAVSQSTASDAAAAIAQSTSQTQPTSPAADSGSIIVTGTRIKNPNGDSAVPITSVTAAELHATGSVSVGDTLNDIPGLANTFSQQNSTRFLGTAGLNLIDLYNLGTQRTLVLVNGRRHVASDVLNNAVSTDINTIPSDLIERVDIVTGGQSAIYGSDAIAGVVNFVLKDHFDGIEVNGQGAISKYKDAGAYSTSVLLGKNFSEGRGNIAVDLEYAHQNSLYASDRDYLQHRDGFVTTGVDATGLPGNSDGIPDAIFVRDIRSGTISDGGLIGFRSTAGACGKDSLGRSFTCNYIFQPNGTLVPETGTRIGLSANAGVAAGSFLGGNGDSLREGTLVQLQPRLDRYSANWLGHFEVSSAFVPFMEGSFVRTKTLGQGGSGPAFFQGSTLDALYERPQLSNPYLSDQARGVITAQFLQIAQSGFNPTTGAAFASPAAQAAYIATINNGTARFKLQKNLTDLGTRTEQAQRDTFRFVLGARGDIASHLHYEVSGNYGQFVEHTEVLGNVNVQRLLLALDTTKNAAGQIVCRGVADPALGGDLGGNPAVLANDIATCQPLNPFGTGNVSQAARDYIDQNTKSYGKLTQIDVNAFVTGDTGAFFNLPGGPLRFSAGGEYRRETNRFREDPLVASGYTFYNAIAAFDPPSFVVKEAYGEVQLPLLKDLPLIKELEVDGAGRVANYKGSAGTNWTYNGNVIYKPVQGFGFRGSYARAVRAPNLSELYSPASQNFAPSFLDPCSADNLARGTANRIANCNAAGRPANYNYAYQSSLEIQSGGNPNLKPETSRSITAGIDLQPPMIPGLTLTSDYYDIKVSKVISAVDAQTIVNQCYDLPSTSNAFCGLFQRAGATGGPNGEEPFRIIEGSLLQSSLNFAKLHTRGINTDISYRRSFDAGKYAAFFHFIWNHEILNDEFVDPTDPTFKDKFNTTLGYPKDEFTANFIGTIDKISFSYKLHYISHMLVNAYDATNSVQGRPPTNADATDILFYPSVTYHDVRVGYNVNAGSEFYVGVDNLTNRLPPLGSTGIAFGSGIYDDIGRRFYVGVSAKF